MINFAISIAIKIREVSRIKFLTVDCYEHRLSYYIDKYLNKIDICK